MNVQLSVILWTVICFTLFMLILRNWLFGPVLKILDERREKLEAAREKKAISEKMVLEHKKNLEVQQAEYVRQKKADLQIELERIQAEEKTLLKTAHRECLERIDAYRKQVEKEQEEILSAVSPRLDQVAEVFAQRIISHKV